MATGELDDDPDEPIEVGDDEVEEPDEFMGSPTEQRSDGEGVKRYINDVTIGSYGVVVENGPSYSTRRDESKAGMEALMKAVPNVVPLILDLYVKAQDWPLAQDMAERIQATLPPAIQDIIAREKAKAEGKPAPDMPPPGAPPGQPAAPQGPPPEVVQAEMAKLGPEVAKAKAGADTAMANARKAEIDLKIRELELQAELRAGTGGRPHRKFDLRPGRRGGADPRHGSTAGRDDGGRTCRSPDRTRIGARLRRTGTERTARRGRRSLTGRKANSREDMMDGTEVAAGDALPETTDMDATSTLTSSRRKAGPSVRRCASRVRTRRGWHRFSLERGSESFVIATRLRAEAETAAGYSFGAGGGKITMMVLIVGLTRRPRRANSSNRVRRGVLSCTRRSSKRGYVYSTIRITYFVGL